MAIRLSHNLQNDKILSTIIHQIVEAADPDKIILFGSRATGKQKEDSDYDICVLKKKIKKDRKLAMKIHSEIDVMAPIDIIVSTPVRFNKQKNKWYYVYSDIAKFGKVIYEK